MLACVTGTKRGGGGEEGEKREGENRQPPPPLRLSLPPNPLPLSTPATQVSVMFTKIHLKNAFGHLFS